MYRLQIMEQQDLQGDQEYVPLIREKCRLAARVEAGYVIILLWSLTDTVHVQSVSDVCSRTRMHSVPVMKNTMKHEHSLYKPCNACHASSPTTLPDTKPISYNMSRGNIPPDILFLIALELESNKDILNMLLMNREMHGYQQMILFPRLTLNLNNNDIERLESFCNFIGDRFDKIQKLKVVVRHCPMIHSQEEPCTKQPNYDRGLWTKLGELLEKTSEMKYLALRDSFCRHDNDCSNSPPFNIFTTLNDGERLPDLLLKLWKTSNLSKVERLFLDYSGVLLLRYEKPIGLCLTHLTLSLKLPKPPLKSFNPMTDLTAVSGTLQQLTIWSEGGVEHVRLDDVPSVEFSDPVVYRSMRSLFIYSDLDPDQLLPAKMVRAYPELRRLHLGHLFDTPLAGFSDQAEYLATEMKEQELTIWKHLDYLCAEGPCISLLGLKGTVGTVCMPVCERSVAQDVCEAIKTSSLHIKTNPETPAEHIPEPELARFFRADKVRIDIRSRIDEPNFSFGYEHARERLSKLAEGICQTSITVLYIRYEFFHEHDEKIDCSATCFCRSSNLSTLAQLMQDVLCINFGSPVKHLFFEVKLTPRKMQPLKIFQGYYDFSTEVLRTVHGDWEQLWRSALDMKNCVCELQAEGIRGDSTHLCW